ncbi:MAG: hypothetical protein KBC91_01530 [Candidatus Omnitrophica bacterium]|nr:hypothetical protein [Candidatus Omnitrophota bacterium]
MSFKFFLDQVAGLLGAAMVLIAYFFMQTGFLKNTAYPFLILNLLGGALLFIASAVTGQLGLILLEGTWTAISAYAIMKRLKQEMSD